MIKRANQFSSAMVRLLIIVLAVIIPLNLLTIRLSRTVLQEVEKQISLETENALNLYCSQIDDAMGRATLIMNRFVRSNVHYLSLSDKSTEEQGMEAQMQSIVNLHYEVRQKLEDHTLIDGIMISFPAKDIVILGGAVNAKADEIRGIIEAQYEIQGQAQNKSWRIGGGSRGAYLFTVETYRNGYYALWIDLYSLMNKLSLSGRQEKILYCLTDREGKCYFSSQEQIAELKLDHSTLRLNENDYKQIAVNSARADLCIVQLISQGEINRLLPVAVRILQVFSFAALLIIPLIMFAIQKLVIAPINKLLDALEHIDQGDLDYRIDSAKRYGSEFDALNRHFNHTMDEVTELKIRIYEEKLKAQKIHLRFLSQQIRPHFILNTLNILYSYEKEDFPLIQRMILCLSRYFRYVVNANEDYVLLGQEIAHICNYFEIQQARFLRTFQSEIECDESLYNCMIPPLLIQSFAENAIKYALRPGEIISIAIHAEAMTDGRLHISVTDNGTGISDEALAKIQRFTKTREYQKDLGVGIQNAIDRLDLLYHGEGNVQVSKNEPRGTRVDIVMPILRKEMSDDECDFD